MNRQNSENSQNGFTLPEILIVIGAMAVMILSIYAFASYQIGNHKIDAPKPVVSLPIN